MLNDMEFIARHGAQPHEQEVDQKFKVDIEVVLDGVRQAGMTDDLSLTVNYADIFEIIAGVMYGEHVNLLETLAYRIATKIINNYRSVEEVTIKVCKLNPPILNFNGTATALLTLKGQK